MTTLRRERRTKFEETIQSSLLHYYARLHLEHNGNTPEYVENTLRECREDLAATLAIEAESRSEKRTDEEKGDYITQANRKVDAILDMANFPGAKREARVSAIQSYLGETFHRNTETKEWLKFARFIDDKQQNSGEDVKVFVAWLLGQKNYDPQFWPVSKMMEFWPSAFVSVQSPQRPELEKYVPDNQNQFVPRPK